MSRGDRHTQPLCERRVLFLFSEPCGRSICGVKRSPLHEHLRLPQTPPPLAFARSRCSLAGACRGSSRVGANSPLHKMATRRKRASDRCCCRRRHRGRGRRQRCRAASEQLAIASGERSLARCSPLAARYSRRRQRQWRRRARVFVCRVAQSSLERLATSPKTTTTTTTTRSRVARCGRRRASRQRATFAAAAAAAAAASVARHTHFIVSALACVIASFADKRPQRRAGDRRIATATRTTIAE